MPSPYVGRFAPSPTGVLHAGSLVAALASWLDARAHQGRWLMRIEDVDTPRCQPGAAEFILQQLARCHLLPDAPPLWQSQRASAYAQALHQLTQSGLAYPCTCSRKAIEQALLARGWQPVRHGEKPYPGTCRPARQPVQPADTPAPTAARASHAPAHAPVDAPVDAPADAAADVPADATGHAPTGAQPRLPAWRLRTDAPNGADTHIRWQDRHLGPQHQNLSQEVGDFVLKRADGLWAYQLAVVVDDAAQGVTDVVRGQDLADNTPRQIHLQHALGLPTPRYLHTPLVLAEDGQKLSKQNGAAALNLTDPLAALRQAGAALGLPSDLPGTTPAQWLAGAVAAWQATWPG